jgi:hypothetical protein
MRLYLRSLLLHKESNGDLGLRYGVVTLGFLTHRHHVLKTPTIYHIALVVANFVLLKQVEMV